MERVQQQHVSNQSSLRIIKLLEGQQIINTTMNTLTAETETFTAGRVQKFHVLSSWHFVVSYLQLFPVAVVMKRMP